MGKEIEIRFELLNASELSCFLDANAIRVYKTHQIDTYYDNPKNSFVNDINHIYDWLRVRDEDGKFSINYKHWLPDDAVIRTYCEEHELLLSSAEEMDRLLKCLGYDVFIVVDKTRTVWTYKEFEIAIDVVVNLGEYIEIEYKGKDYSDIPTIQESLYSILSEVEAKVGAEDHGGYGFKLIRKK